MKNILILDANQRSALATTRSLGKHHIRIFTAEESTTSLAGKSKYAIKHFSYPSPKSEPEKFLLKIEEITRNNEIQIIFPMTELTTELILKGKERFSDVALPFPSMDQINALSDKCNLFHLAQKLEIPIPSTLHFKSSSDIGLSLDDLSYPIVIKPGKSWLFNGIEWYRTSVRYANSSEEAHKILLDADFQTHPFMIQQCVSGHGEGVFALYENGRAIAFFAHRRLREKPPSGGVSVLSESVPVDALLMEHAKALLDHTNWHGVAMVEFKVTSDGTPYLMEVNTRFWGSLQLSIDSGVDFPWLLYQIVSKNKPEPIKNYTYGNKLRWLLGDLDSLYLSLKDKRSSIRVKLGALVSFLKPSYYKTKHEINRLEDINPAIYELKCYIKDILKKLPPSKSRNNM